jgi:hypothetical protein
MANAIKPNDTALVGKWLNEKGKLLITQMMTMFMTATLVSKFGGVRKSLDLATFDNVKSLLRGYKKDVTTKGDEFEYGKVTLEVAKFMLPLDMTYMDDEIEAFVAYMEGMGENIDNLKDDVMGEKFMRWLIDKAMEVADEELEEGIWNAIKVTTGVNAADDADLIHKFTGLRRQAAVICNGNGSIVNTGASNATNAYANVNKFYKEGFNKKMKRKGAYILCSFNFFDDYKLSWQAANDGRELGTTRFEKTNYEVAPIYLGGGKSFLMPIEGLGDDDVLIGCRLSDIAMGYDMLGNWLVQPKDFTLRALAALKFGCTWLMRKPGYLVVNDRLIAVEITTPRVNA